DQGRGHQEARRRHSSREDSHAVEGAHQPNRQRAARRPPPPESSGTAVVEGGIDRVPLGEDNKTLLEKYGPYVRSLASQVRKQFSGSIELEELMAYGQVGLLEAANRFDPKVGANFLTFAHYRIKGAIFDGLRKMGVLKGSEARQASAQSGANSYMGNLSDRDSGSNRGPSADDDVR